MRFDNNHYSVAARAVGRPVDVRAYADRIVIRQDGETVAEHPRSFGRGEIAYDPWHYVPEAVEAACAEALDCGACSADVVLNILARQCQPAPPATIPTPEGLQLRHRPVADCQRYDRLREAGHGAS